MASYTHQNAFIAFFQTILRLFYDIAAHEYDEKDDDGLLSRIEERYNAANK